MGIFINDDEDDIESGVEHSLSRETNESVSPAEGLRNAFEKNNETLERAIAENNPETIESLRAQIGEYEKERETVINDIAQLKALEAEYDATN